MMLTRLKVARLSAWDVVFSLILAVMFAISPHYIANGSVPFTGILVLTVVLYLAVFLAATAGIRFALERLDLESSIFLRLLQHRYALLILTLLMFLCWLPVLIILYPGTVINDTWGQLSQFVYTFYSDSTVHFEFLGDHHPVLTTFIMGQIIIPLANVTGNLQVALFIYALLQSFVTCLAFSSSVLYVYRTLKVSSGFAMIMFLLYAFLPIFPGSAQTISKDALHAWIFVFFTIAFLEVVRTKGESLDSAYRFDLFILLSWVCCATKKVSFYVVVISLLFAIPFLRKNRKKILGIIIACVALMLFLWPAVMHMTGITGGGKTEMLSLPYQMTARYVKEHPEDITSDEYAVLDKMLYMGDLAERYDPVSADPVKGFAFYERFENADYAAYGKVWLAQGLRHPGSYVNALLAMESGWFSWTDYYPVMDMNWHSQLNPSIFSETSTVRPEGIRSVADRYQKLIQLLHKTPVAGILFTYGLYAALIPAFVICTLLGNRKRNSPQGWIAAVPMLLSIALGCWLAPVSIHFEGRRYLYPVTYTALLLIAWCHAHMKERV